MAIRRPARRSDTTLEVAGRQPAERAIDVGRGCAPRPARRRGRSRTPPEVAKPEGRGGTGTRVLRPESAVRSTSDAQTWRGLGCARSSRQTVAALVTPRLQHSAASAGAHPMTKPVLLGTTQIVGLERALHADLRALGGDDMVVVGADCDSSRNIYEQVLSQARSSGPFRQTVRLRVAPYGPQPNRRGDLALVHRVDKAATVNHSSVAVRWPPRTTTSLSPHHVDNGVENDWIVGGLTW